MKPLDSDIGVEELKATGSIVSENVSTQKPVTLAFSLLLRKNSALPARDVDCLSNTLATLNLLFPPFVIGDDDCQETALGSV